jgi:tetratricopeptide (TPR) repeat protein
MAREALYATGHALLEQERHAQAAAVFRILLRLCPSDERGWLALGECHVRAGHDDLALELFSAASVALHDAPRCALARFRLLYDAGRTDEADAAHETAVEMAERSEDQELIAISKSERSFRP